MSGPTARLAFFKLNVPNLESATWFWREAFGFAIAGHFDEPEFRENILTIPEQDGGPSLMLVEYKDGRDVTVGPGHGPVGLVCNDIAASHVGALNAGAVQVSGVFEAAGIQIAVLKSPEGHEIELIQPRG